MKKNEERNVTEMHTRVEGEMKLNPCRCGSDKVWYSKKETENGERWEVICDDCGHVFGADCKTQEAVRDLWNENTKPTFKEIRLMSGMNQKQFSNYFNIPYRTIQGWELGERKCPDYLIDLMKYKIDNERLKAGE